MELLVQTSDVSGVERVVIAYTDNRGSWESVDLVQGEASGLWQGAIPASHDLDFFVQAVDAAGNVAVDHNNGQYYRLGRVYLPIVVVGWSAP